MDAMFKVVSHFRPNVISKADKSSAKPLLLMVLTTPR